MGVRVLVYGVRELVYGVRVLVYGLHGTARCCVVQGVAAWL